MATSNPITAASNGPTAELNQHLNQEAEMKRHLDMKLSLASRTFDELLCAAEGLKQLGKLISIADEELEDLPKLGCLVLAMGRHIQMLRNQAAEELEPVYEKLNLEPICY